MVLSAADRLFDSVSQHLVRDHGVLKELEAARMTSLDPAAARAKYVCTVSCAGKGKGVK